MNEIDQLGARWIAAHLAKKFGETIGLPQSEIDKLRYAVAGAWVDYAVAAHRGGRLPIKSVEREARRLGLESDLRLK